MDVAIYLIVGVVASSVVIARGCNMTTINQCIPILSRDTDIDMVTEGISAIPSADQLKIICSMLDEFEACYKPKAAECGNNVVYTMTFGTIEKTLNYLCVEGYNDILKHETCWNNTGVIEGTKRCHEKQNNDNRALRLNPGDKTKMKQKWCQILENTTTCVEETITTYCGDAPACIMKTMLDRALVGLSGLMQCTLPTPCNITETSTTTPSSIRVIIQSTVPNTASVYTGVLIFPIFLLALLEHI